MPHCLEHIQVLHSLTGGAPRCTYGGGRGSLLFCCSSCCRLAPSSSRPFNCLALPSFVGEPRVDLLVQLSELLLAPLAAGAALLESPLRSNSERSSGIAPWLNTPCSFSVNSRAVSSASLTLLSLCCAATPAAYSVGWF